MKIVCLPSSVMILAPTFALIPRAAFLIIEFISCEPGRGPADYCLCFHCFLTRLSRHVLTIDDMRFDANHLQKDLMLRFGPSNRETSYVNHDYNRSNKVIDASMGS